jgi:hypothetical protein
MSTPDLPPRLPYGSSLRPIDDSDLTASGAGFDFGDDYYDLDFEGYEPGWGDRFRNLVGRGLVRLGWLVLAAGLAFGSAGIVAAGEPPPSSGSRPELTWAADQALATRISAAIRDLARLNDDVDSLGTQARKVLSSLTQINQIDLQAAWNDGTNAAVAIDTAAAALNDRLQCAAWDSTLQATMNKTYSPALVDRFHKVCLAIASVAPLHDDWQAMVDGSRTAIRVANDIEAHDSIATGALQSATQGRYPDALAQLKGASDAIADATAIANRLALVADVSTLSDWLSRIAQMDAALALVWQSMIDSNGMITAKVTAALRLEQEANDQLPQTNAVFGVVMYELAKAENLASYGIPIETAKGALAAALDDLNGGTVFGM